MSDFAKGMQTVINHYVTKDRINNVSFRQKLDPIVKNIIRRQNPLELVFEGISTFDAEDRIVGKKDFASDLIKKARRPPGLDITLRSKLNKLKNKSEPKDNNNNLSPPEPPPLPP